jgi:hypothetical protein
MVFHVLNHGVARIQLFVKSAALERVLRETRDESPMRICFYSLMSDRWHLLLWPEHGGGGGRRGESDQANRRTFDQDNRWIVVEAAGGLNCCASA